MADEGLQRFGMGVADAPNALTKAQMADRLFDELGLNKREAKEIVEVFFERVRASLECNEHVKLSGFGNFDLRDKSQRPGRNPKTGEEIPITARRVVTFRPGRGDTLSDLGGLEDVLESALGLKIDLTKEKNLRDRVRPYILHEVQRL